jgi:hypothetical protein
MLCKTFGPQVEEVHVTVNCQIQAGYLVQTVT